MNGAFEAPVASSLAREQNDGQFEDHRAALGGAVLENPTLFFPPLYTTQQFKKKGHSP